MTSSRSNNECVLSFSGLSSTTSLFTGQRVDSTASLSPSSRWMGTSQPIITVSLLPHDPSRRHCSHTNTHTKRCSASRSCSSLYTVVWNSVFLNMLSIPSLRAWWKQIQQEGIVGIRWGGTVSPVLCKLTLGISNKAKTTLTDKPVRYRLVKTAIPWLNKQIRFFSQVNFWQFWAADWLRHYHQRQAGREKHISEVRRETMKLSAN